MEVLFKEGVSVLGLNGPYVLLISIHGTRALMSRGRSGLAQTKCSVSLGFCWFAVLGSQGAVLSLGDMVVPLDTVMR